MPALKKIGGNSAAKIIGDYVGNYRSKYKTDFKNDYYKKNGVNLDGSLHGRQMKQTEIDNIVNSQPAKIIGDYVGEYNNKYIGNFNKPIKKSNNAIGNYVESYNNKYNNANFNNPLKGIDNKVMGDYIGNYNNKYNSANFSNPSPNSNSLSFPEVSNKSSDILSLPEGSTIPLLPEGSKTQSLPNGSSVPLLPEGKSNTQPNQSRNIYDPYSEINADRQRQFDFARQKGLENERILNQSEIDRIVKRERFKQNVVNGFKKGVNAVKGSYEKAVDGFRHANYKRKNNLNGQKVLSQDEIDEVMKNHERQKDFKDIDWNGKNSNDVAKEWAEKAGSDEEFYQRMGMLGEENASMINAKHKGPNMSQEDIDKLFINADKVGGNPKAKSAKEKANDFINEHYINPWKDGDYAKAVVVSGGTLLGVGAVYNNMKDRE